MYNVMYMGSTRTQIYLTEELRSKVDAECQRTGKSLAQVIRDALQEYLAARSTEDYQRVLDETFGSIPDMPYPDRSEWYRAHG